MLPLPFRFWDADCGNPKSNPQNLRSPFSLIFFVLLPLIFSWGCAHQTGSRKLQGEVTEPKVNVGKIAFEGNRSFSTKLLKARLRLKEGREFDDFLFQEDKRKLKSFYRRHGFLEMKLSTRSKFDGKTGKLDHTFVISEGVQTSARSVSVAGNRAATDKELMDVITLKAKEPLNMTAVDLSSYAIANLYANKGYPYAAVDTAIVRDTLAHAADVTFEINEGALVHVGTLEIRYLQTDSNAPPPRPRVRRGMIERELTLHPGDVLSAQKLYDTQQRVYATGLFKNVKFEQVGREEKREVVNLILWVEEERLHYVGVGVGYQSPDFGLISPEWGHDNLLNNGQQLALRAVLGYGFTVRNGAHDYRQDYDATYTEPKFLSSSFRGVAHAFYLKDRLTTRIKPDPKDTALARVHPEPYDSSTALTQTGGEARLERTFPGNLQLVFGYRNIYVVEGKNTTSSLAASASKDGRNDFFNPTRGGFASLTSEAAGGILQGGNDFVRTVAEASLFVTPFSRLTLGSHLKGGAIQGYGRSRTIPAYEAFKLGGGNSIRGYEEGSILLTSGLLGNRESLLQGNLEARVPLLEFPLPPYGMISGVAFGDGGNVWPGFAGVTWRNAKYGYGAGLRYLTPIGPARVDFGWPAEKASRLNDPQIYVNLGHAF